MISSLKTTLKVQPAVILFSTVSIMAKLASRRLPDDAFDLGTKVQMILTDWRLFGLVFLMFVVLGIYAIVWQILIKDAQIAVIYANKSSYILWTQLAAVFFFGEHFTWQNFLGIVVIFGGILLINGGKHGQP